MHKKCCK